jgi:hypothetical protein
MFQIFYFPINSSRVNSDMRAHTHVGILRLRWTLKVHDMKENFKFIGSFPQVTHTKFHRNPFIASRLLTFVRAYGRTEILIDDPKGYKRVKNDNFIFLV